MPAAAWSVKNAEGLREMILCVVPFELLRRAEAFIFGFEDDELQEGIPELLAALRAVQAMRDLL